LEGLAETGVPEAALRQATSVGTPAVIVGRHVSLQPITPEKHGMKLRIVPLLDGCLEGVHVDVDDLPLAVFVHRALVIFAAGSAA